MDNSFISETDLINYRFALIYYCCYFSSAGQFGSDTASLNPSSDNFVIIHGQKVLFFGKNKDNNS